MTPGTSVKWIARGIAAVLLVAAVAVPARAAGPGRLRPALDSQGDESEDVGGGRGVKSWWTNPRVVERLGLSPEQRQKIEDLAYKAGDRLVDLRADQAKAQLALSHLLDAENLDQSALDKAAEQVTATQCALAREQVQVRVEIARVLTREQRLALREMVRDTIRTRMGRRR